MQDPAQPGALQDSEASNFEEEEKDRRAGASNVEQDDDNEAGAPLPQSVDPIPAKSEKRSEEKNVYCIECAIGFG